jgi:rhodanese-related sulfurtransferase
MNTITPADLHQRLTAQPDLAVLDVRTAGEFDSVHVPQARSVPLDSLDPTALLSAGTVRPGQPVYLLCQSGGRARRAAEKFTAVGIENAVVVAGGTQAWIEAGLPVTRGHGVISLERQVRIGAGSMVLLGVVLGWTIHPYFFGLSAFVGAGLVFAGVTDFCGMGLLLAKAPWNQRRPA